MPSSACVDITGTGSRVAAEPWNSLSYSMIQIISSTRPPKTVSIQANKAAMLISRGILQGRWAGSAVYVYGPGAGRDWRRVSLR